MKAILIIGFSFLLMSHACQKEALKEDCETPTGENSITGTWKWVSTDGGLGNHIHETPVTTGNTIQLSLQSNGQYAFITNGVVSSTGTYRLESKNCIHSNTQKTFINFSGDTDLMIEKPVTNTAVLMSDDVYDGVTILYKK